MTVVSDFTALVTTSSWSGTSVTGRSVILTYSFETSAQSYLAANGYQQPFIDSFRALNATEQGYARQALQMWAAACGITFIEVSSGQGDIRFAEFNFDLRPGYETSAGYASFPGRTLETSGAFESAIGGDVFINTRYGANVFLIAHELGHALGLKHPFEGDPTLATGLDNQGQTVLSYTPGFTGQLGPLDIQAAQYLYGAPSADGTHVSSWSWSVSAGLLTQIGTGAGDRIVGVTPADYIDGGLGNDLIAGFGGNDQLRGGAGVDSVFGGTGNDYIDGGSEGDVLTGDEGYDAIYGAAGNDTIYGDADHDVLVGDAGNDQLFGGSGNDVLSELYDVTNSGDDTMSGEDGVDIIYSANGADTVYGGGDAANNYADLGEGNDSFVGANGTDVVVGVGGDDTIFGGNGANSLYGGQGGDYIDGGAGIDLLSGGIGDDTLRAGSENNSLVGDAGSDYLTGEAGVDVLYGGADNDTLMGGADVDALYGGTGNDWFYVGGTGFGYDYVWDFAGGAGASDMLVFQSGHFASAAAVRAASTYAGGNTTISVPASGGAVVVLVGVNIASVLDEDIYVNGSFS